MGQVTSDQDAADSIAAWGATDVATYNNYGNGVAFVPSPTGTVPHTPQEVDTYLGNNNDSTWKGVTSKVLAKGTSATIGIVTSEAHDPCE